MAVSVVMPALEMAQETGKLVSWKKKEGEQVKKGEILLEVETDKAVVEIEAAVDGVLAEVLVGPGGHARDGEIALLRVPLVLADFVGHLGEVELDCWAGGFGLCGQQRFGLIVGGEQGFKARA